MRNIGPIMQIFGPTTSPTGASALDLRRIESSLHQTVWRLGGPDTTVYGLVLLDEGEGVIEARDGSRHMVPSRALCWRAGVGGLRFSSNAGSTGYVGSINEAYFADGNTDYANAQVLEFIAQRDRELALSAGDLQLLLGIVTSIHDELRAPRAGSPIVIASQVRILLVSIARLAGLEDSFEGTGSEARYLQHFRVLLEANFRAHWPVARYAATVGISHDRLHSVCTRKLGRTPKALIAERIAREAALGLERSTLSLEQLSYALGFRDPAHFSHFFKRTTGLAPGAFRRLMRTASGTRPASPTNFADWP